jgi:regulator of sigma D
VVQLQANQEMVVEVPEGQPQEQCQALVSYQISAGAHLNTAAAVMEQMVQEAARQETMQAKPMQPH